MSRIIFKILRMLGLPILFREILQKNKVTILLFHDLKSTTADKTFKYLAKTYNIISLDSLVYALENRDFSKIPSKALVITFDDGHIGNYELLQVVKKQKIPITIFLCASLINTNRHYWFRYQNNSCSVEALKQVSNHERLKILSEYGFKQEKEFEQPQVLQADQINQMKPFINFQSHTLFHPILPKCTYDVAKSEIGMSKEILETQFNLSINAISYPNGDYSDRDIELSKQAGYKCGLTVDYGYNTLDTDPFKLKRFSVNDTGDMNELVVKASGLWAYITSKRNKKFGYTKITE